MRLFLDTHLLLWAASGSDKLTKEMQHLIENEMNELYFSPASLWEIAIKAALKKTDFKIDTHVLRRNLLDNGYLELPIQSNHVVIVQDLPLIHKDPFDRILIAQAIVEGLTLYTSDALIAQYPGPIIYLL
jgi:PIN domain nuclease of toxin-antitoxin system